MKGKIIIALIIALVLGGLNNYRELNDIAIVSAISIDREGEEYIVSAQIMNSKKETSGTKSGGNSSNITVYTAKSKTINNALINMMSESPREIYISHMKLLVIQEEVAKNGIGDCLDFFLRDNESDKEAMVVIAKNKKASDVLKVLTPIETNPTKNLVDSIKSVYSYDGNTVQVKMSDAIGSLLEKGVEMVLASVTIDGDVSKAEDEESLKKSESQTKILVSNIAYFKKDKLMGYLEDTDNLMHNIIRGNIQKTVIEIDNDINIAAELFNIKTSVKPKQGDENILDINCKMVTNITEIEKGKEVSDDELRKHIEDYIKGCIEKYVYNTQNVYNSDVIGIGAIYDKFMHSKFNNEFDFKNVKCNVSVDVEIKTKGGSVKKW